MTIPTEPIGSVPRSQALIDGIRQFEAAQLSKTELDRLRDNAVKDTIRSFEATGSAVITDGEQTKPSFLTYPLHNHPHLAPDGVIIPFEDGHTRQLPRLTSGPFRYQVDASSYLRNALRYTQRAVKQAVITASALSLIYPNQEINGYPKTQFLDDLVDEVENDIRQCLTVGAHCVQMDFTEGRLAIKLDPTKQLLKHFIELNNRVLSRFTIEQRKSIGVHTCPGGDHDSTHSADIDYDELLPDLFRLAAGNFYIQLASERDRRRVLKIIQQHSKPEQRIFVGVIDPINPEIETPEEVKSRILEAAEFIEPHRLGATDDCGFSPFGDDTSTARQIAFKKIESRVIGTELANESLGL